MMVAITDVLAFLFGFGLVYGLMVFLGKREK